MAKTNTGLVAYAKAKLGHPYWYGCFGQVSTRALYDGKKKQYPNYYEWTCENNQPGVSPKTQLGVQVFDCIGLIKGYLWSASTNATPSYNASQDVSANGMRGKCTKVGKISTLPEVPGILLFSQGHVGVYIGNGKAIEARGHKYGVVETKVADRGWTSWGYCPWITYEKTATTTATKTTTAKTTTTKTTTTSSTTTTKSTTPSYTVGKTYTLTDNLNVRTGPGTAYRQKKRSELTADGKKHAKIQTYATFKKGTKITCKAIKKVGNDIWVQAPSGWLAAYYNGKQYIK